MANKHIIGLWVDALESQYRQLEEVCEKHRPEAVGHGLNIRPLREALADMRQALSTSRQVGVDLGVIEDYERKLNEEERKYREAGIAVDRLVEA